MCIVFYLTLSGADSKPSIRYFVCKSHKFQHLNCSNKPKKGFKKRKLEGSIRYDLTDKVTKGGFVIFGVIGKYTDKDLRLFPKGNAGSLLKKKSLLKIYTASCFIIKQHLIYLLKWTEITCEEYENKNPSEAVPVLCFQSNLPRQSALEVCFFTHKAGMTQKFIN